MLIDQPLRRCQSREAVQARARRAIAATQVDVDLGDAELLADCDPHSVAPIGIGKAALDRLDARVPHPTAFDRRRRRHDPDVVAFKIYSRLRQQMAKAKNGRRHG